MISAAYTQGGLMSKPIDPQLQTMIDNMPEKTGKALTDWYGVISDAGLQDHGPIMKLLKGEHGVTHGFANTITILYRQQAAGGPPPEEDLIDGQYAGAKAGLRPVYEAILKIAGRFGSDVEVAPKKGYVSLRRSKQFAIVKPAARDRIDLGLNLKGVDGTERLEGGKAFGGMCTHLVKINAEADLDGELIDWLRQAYDGA